MEILYLLGIALKECVRGIYHRRFDTLSFWNQCMRVNIIYTKFFQSVALNYDLNVEIHRIPYREEEVEYPTDIAVTGIIGSGLISIVFEGVNETGQPIVIKTKRKNIEARVHSSLNTLSCLLNCIHRFFPIPCLLESYYEISYNFKKQLDFDTELKNHQRFYDMFKHCEYIKVPQLYPSECSEHRLVMEKIEGLPITDLTTEQKDKYMSWMSKMIVQCLVKHGFIHGDLHAGNMFFQDTHLGIIDFGFMITILPKEVEVLGQLFTEFAMGNLTAAAQHTLYFLNSMERLTPEQVEDVKDFIVHIYQRTTVVDKIFSAYDVLQIMKKIRMYDVSISPTFYQIGIGLTAIDSVLKKVSSTTTDFFLAAVMEVLSIQVEKGEGEDHGRQGDDE